MKHLLTACSNALGAGLWTTASTFTMISAFSDEEGQVEASDLTPLLNATWTACTDQLKSLGKIAMGGGGDYSSLPTAPGSGYASVALDPESYIAGFFSDGKWLLAESDETYQSSVEYSYGSLKTKVVDQALQTGGLAVFGLTDLETEGTALLHTSPSHGTANARNR